MMWVAVAAVIFRNGRVLAMRRAPGRPGAGLWETLSGRVHPGEDPLAAIEREIAEECGLEVELDPRPVDAYAARRGESPMTVLVYRAEHREGEVVRSLEHDAHEWLTPEEFARTSSLSRLAELIARIA